MMDLYSVLVEGLIGGPMLTLLILVVAIFIYLAWCGVGVYSNLMVINLFSLCFLWITGNILFVGCILIWLFYGLFAESKKELAEA